METTDLIERLSAEINTTVTEAYNDLLPWDNMNSQANIDIAQASCDKWLEISLNIDITNDAHQFYYIITNEYV